MSGEMWGNYVLYTEPFFSVGVSRIKTMHHRFRTLCPTCVRTLTAEGRILALDEDDPVTRGSDCDECGAIFGDAPLKVVR